MKRIAKFHKVSAERFMADWKDTFPETAGEKKSYPALPAVALTGSLILL